MSNERMKAQAEHKIRIEAAYREYENAKANGGWVSGDRIKVAYRKFVEAKTQAKNDGFDVIPEVLRRSVYEDGQAVVTVKVEVRDQIP